jgi:hypothetical protein
MSAPPRTATEVITIAFRPRYNEQGEHMLWMVSWLVNEEGQEGEWFYSGSGGESSDFAVPQGTLGLRIRRWPTNGLDPEYVDLSLAEIHGPVSDRGLRFDHRQRFSRLQEED